MSKKILRLLVIDDSPDDADLVSKNLRIARFMLKSQRVSDAATLESALEKSRWDVVVCEHTLTNFNARLALEHLKRHNLSIPVIVFTRSIGDNELTAIMQAGVRDVVNKDRPTRLIPAIERELKTAKEHAELQRARQTLQELEERHRAMVDSAHEAVCYCHDGMHIDANQTYLQLFGYENQEELEILPVMNLIDKSDQAAFKDFIKKAGKEDDTALSGEFLASKKDGSTIDIQISVAAVNYKDEDCLQFKINDISSRKVAEKRLKFLSQRDALTGLYNRNYFQQLLQDALDNTKKNGGSDSLIYIDLYGLQSINNRLGYTEGDRILLRISKQFSDALTDNAILARAGGDEFVVLLPGKNEKQALETAGALKKTLSGSALCEDGETGQCQAAFSLIMVDKQSPSAQELLAEAHTRCQKNRKAAEPAETITEESKQPSSASPPQEIAIVPDKAGVSPEPILTSEPEVETRTAETPDQPIHAAETVDAWQQRIQTALDSNAFQLLYQPIINLHGKAAEYYEVLSRMLDEQHNPVSPREFIGEAERTGQIVAIDKWVTQHAIEALGELDRQERQATFFVNLSAAVFIDDSFIPFLQEQLKTSQIPAKQIVFEVDEPVVAQNPGLAGEFLAAIAHLGYQVCLDNYGKLFDTLLNLPRKAVKYLKINSKTVTTIASDEDKQSFDALMEMTKKLEIKTIAKCVEDATSLAELWPHGFDYVQGDYFQQADSELNYDFVSEDEATLDSNSVGSTWR